MESETTTDFTTEWVEDYKRRNPELYPASVPTGDKPDSDKGQPRGEPGARGKRGHGVSEKDWQSQFLELAHLAGWKCAHFRPAMTGRTYLNGAGEEKHIWVTAVQGDGKGFPDNL